MTLSNFLVILMRLKLKENGIQKWAQTHWLGFNILVIYIKYDKIQSCSQSFIILGTEVIRRWMLLFSFCFFSLICASCHMFMCSSPCCPVCIIRPNNI